MSEISNRLLALIGFLFCNLACLQLILQNFATGCVKNKIIWPKNLLRTIFCCHIQFYYECYIAIISRYNFIIFDGIYCFGDLMVNIYKINMKLTKKRRKSTTHNTEKSCVDFSTISRLNYKTQQTFQ